MSKAYGVNELNISKTNTQQLEHDLSIAEDDGGDDSSMQNKLLKEESQEQSKVEVGQEDLFGGEVVVMDPSTSKNAATNDILTIENQAPVTPNIGSNDTIPRSQEEDAGESGKNVQVMNIQQ